MKRPRASLVLVAALLALAALVLPLGSGPRSALPATPLLLAATLAAAALFAAAALAPARRCCWALPG